MMYAHEHDLYYARIEYACNAAARLALLTDVLPSSPLCRHPHPSPYLSIAHTRRQVVVVDQAEGKTWKEYSARTDGREGYVFGDLTRGVCHKVFGSSKVDTEAEINGDEQFTHVQSLLKEAIKIYQARGYAGTISLSQTVAYFCESASMAIKAPEAAPWEDEDGATKETEHDGSTDKISAEGGKAGLVFATLLARLERRARSWQAFSGVEGLDPNLSQSAQIGFAIPVVKLGWGVSVTLTVSASTLLRWAAHAAALEAASVPAPALALKDPDEEARLDAAEVD